MMGNRLGRVCLLFVAAAMGGTAFLALCRAAGAPLAEDDRRTLWVTGLIVLGAFAGFAFVTRKAQPHSGRGTCALLALVALTVVMGLTTAYQMGAYLRLPADILSYAESGFVTDILELRQGSPLYTPPQDNNSTVYTPAAPVLVYLISSLCGQGDSIPFFRLVQFSFVILASLIAVAITDLLARLFLSPVEYRYRLLWLAAWWPLLFLVATEPRLNQYNHTLHNDGLALLVSMCGFWLMCRHAFRPDTWLLGLMVILPGLGFLAKQNQLMWLGVFGIYLVAIGTVPWRHIVLYALGATVFTLAAFAICYISWGDDFVWWTFTSLAGKKVSLIRTFQHLFWGGLYALMGLIGGWVLVLGSVRRDAAVLWACWLMVFGIQTYTSGFAWAANHMGPGIVLGTCWFFAALPRLWPSEREAISWWPYRLREVGAVVAVGLLFGGLGLIREPRNPVPQDFYRYVADIEKEFSGLAPDKVLLDYGSWVYLKDNVVMNDRGVAVSLHVGKNQSAINHAALAATLRRVEGQVYDKILARELDTDRSSYDFADRGSGVKTAMLTHYDIARRIPAVKGISQWWPMHMVGEVLVLVPKPSTRSVPGAATPVASSGL